MSLIVQYTYARKKPNHINAPLPLHKSDGCRLADFTATDHHERRVSTLPADRNTKLESATHWQQRPSSA
jgi:hypothetical protein